MNIFNKIVVVLILFFFIFISLISIVNEFVERFRWSDIMLRIINPDINIPLFVSIPALLMVLILCIFLLLLEFYRRRKKTAIISSVKTGNAMITLDSIAQQIKNTVISIEGLEDIRVNITPKSNGIIINMAARLIQEVDIPEKMQEIIDKASEIATKKLGIKVLKSNLTITGLVTGKEEKKEVKEIKVTPEESKESEKNFKPED